MMSEQDRLTSNHEEAEAKKEGQIMADKLKESLDNQSQLGIENEAQNVANSTIGAILAAPRESAHFCIMLWFPLSIIISIIAPCFALLMYCYTSQPFAFDFEV